MIDISKGFNENEKEIERLLSKDVKSEKDIYNINMCITYLYRQLVVSETSKNMEKMRVYICSFRDKLNRHEKDFVLKENMIRDLENYRYNDIPKTAHIKRDVKKEKESVILLLVLFTILVTGVVFINVDIGYLLLIANFVYLLGVLIFCFKGKRTFITVPVRVLSMLGDKERAFRDDIWVDAMKHLFREDTDVYGMISKLKSDFSSRYTIEMIHESFIETK